MKVRPHPANALETIDGDLPGRQLMGRAAFIENTLTVGSKRSVIADERCGAKVLTPAAPLATKR